MMASVAGPGWVQFEGHGTDEPLLSVVTVLRRDENGLLATLASVKNAGLANYEHIIIEGDLAPCVGMESVKDSSGAHPNVSWCVEPDAGIYAGMNRGLIAARGEWIWFLNAGDVVPVGFEGAPFESFLAKVEPKTGWVIGDARVVDGSGRTTRYKRARDFSSRGLQDGRYTPCHQAVFVRRREAARVGPFDERLRLVGDYAMFLQLNERSRPALLEEVVVDYLDGGVSGTYLRRRRLEQVIVRFRLVHTSKRMKAIDLARTAGFMLRRSFVRA